MQKDGMVTPPSADQENMAMNRETSGVKQPSHVLVHKQLEDVFLAQQAACESLRATAAEKDSMVPFDEYERVLKELENERIAHAQTKQELMDTQDRLTFAEGEIEVLAKQIEREKKQFEKTFGMLKSRAVQESSKNAALETKCSEIEKQKKHQRDAIQAKDDQIKLLSDRLKKTEAGYKQQLAEIDIKQQQEMYMAQILNKSTGKRLH